MRPSSPRLALRHKGCDCENVCFAFGGLPPERRDTILSLDVVLRTKAEFPLFLPEEAMHIAMYISRSAFKDKKKKKRKERERERKRKKRILRAASYEHCLAHTYTRLIAPGEKRILFRWFRAVATEIHR